jgi:hypothetical protein
MTEKKNELAIIPGLDVAEKLNNSVQMVLGQQGLVGFSKAYHMAEGFRQLKSLLTDEYMKPIMDLQGSRLGFRTDKDRLPDGRPGPGYPVDVVRACLIEGVLMGLQPCGNQINIIGGNMYPTKEGIGSWLNNCKGLKHEIICSLPQINQDGKSAAVNAKIKWSFGGEENETIVPIPIRVNTGMGVDAIMGKATRKARAWLMSRVSGVEVTDADVEDQDAKVVSSTTKKSPEEKESERITLLIQDAKTYDDLMAYKGMINEEHQLLFDTRAQELKPPVSGAKK